MGNARGGGLQVTGLAALVRDLQALGLEVDDLKDVFASIAQRGADLAESFAPRLTGRLAGSIRGNRAKSKAVVTAGYASRVPYAGPINYGWPSRGIAPAAFLQQADDALRPYTIAQLNEGIDAKIREKGLS